MTEFINGWVFYDATCSLCNGWVERTRNPLARRGYHFVPLQARWASERLALREGEALVEMKLLMKDDCLFGGADALVELAAAIWWAWPFWLLGQLPGMRTLLRWGYRRLAANRHCLGGHCKIPAARIHEPGKITSAFYELP
jgi:predicted DCC family thiol-disulfide oxidoreductase YuxK